MDKTLHSSGAAESACAEAAHSNSITLTPGVQETPGALATITATRVALPAIPNTVGLQPRQRIALQALAAGKGPRLAAQLAGVSEPTLYRWRRHHAGFIAAWNAWQVQSAQTAREYLAAANEHAARTIMEAVQAGDVRAALAVMKGLQSLVPARIGPVYAGAVKRKLGEDGDDDRRRMGRMSRQMREDFYCRRQEEKKEAEKAAARRAAERKPWFDLYAQIPPLPRPLTQAAIEQAVKDCAAKVKVYPRRISFTIIAVIGDRAPLIEAIAEYDEIAADVVASRLNALPNRLESVMLWELSEEFARKLESLGATVELRPGWRE